MGTLPAQGNSNADVFQGMSGVRSENLSATERLKIAIVGKPKCGKSWFAASARTPILYYDFDDRPESLAGKPGLLIKSKPTMLDVEQDLSILKARKEKHKQNPNLPLLLPETVCFDTITFMQKSFEDYLYTVAKDSFKDIKVGNSTTVHIRRGWDVINAMQRYIGLLISDFSSLGMDLIFVFHEKNEKDYVESTKEEAAYTGQLSTDPQYLNSCLSLFNEVYHIRVEPGPTSKYIVECKPNISGNWNTTLLIDATEPPNILDMIKKHENKRLQLAATKQNEQTKPTQRS